MYIVVLGARITNKIRRCYGKSLQHAALGPRLCLNELNY